MKKYSTNVRKVCAEKGFYNTLDDPKKEIEHAFELLERYASAAHYKILDKSLHELDLEEITIFFIFLTFLRNRVIARREEAKKEANEWANSINKHFSDWEIVPDERISHLKSMMLSTYQELDEIIFNNWLILKNQTKIPLWTSDNPVVYKKNYDGNGKLMFPLSPTQIMISQKPFDNYFHVKHGILRDPDEVIKLNQKIHLNSYRVTISSQNNFQHILS